MMFKKACTILVLASLSAAVFAQTNVAVLDAEIGEGVSVNASAIVADTINEQFVKSGLFTAIDRAYISSIQEEKNFQLSGDVQDSDIKEMGNTFGADYICIANVGLLGTTYSVSARLIEVATAEVVSQESHRMRGEIDVLFTVAEVVGAELTNADLDSAPVVVLDLPVEDEPEPIVEEDEPIVEEDEPIVEDIWKEEDSELRDDPYEEYEEKSDKVVQDPRILLTLSWLFPVYNGGLTATNGYLVYEQDDSLVGYDSVDLNHIGLDFHMLFPVWKYIYVGGGITYTKETLQAVSDPSTYTAGVFHTIEPHFGFGGIVNFFDVFQVYGGLNLGLMLMTLASDYADDQTTEYWSVDWGEAAVGVGIGFEIGIAAYLKVFCLDVRYKWSQAPSMSSATIDSDLDLDAADTSFGVGGLSVGLGFAF